MATELATPASPDRAAGSRRAHPPSPDPPTPLPLSSRPPAAPSSRRSPLAPPPPLAATTARFATAFALGTSIKALSALVKGLAPLLARAFRGGAATAAGRGSAVRGARATELANLLRYSLRTLFDRDSLRFGLFVGGISGGFGTIRRLLFLLRHACAPLNHLVHRTLGLDEHCALVGETTAAGALCGLSLLFTERRSQWRTAFVLFASVKACEYSAVGLCRRGVLPVLQHVDVTLFSAACTVIM